MMLSFVKQTILAIFIVAASEIPSVHGIVGGEDIEKGEFPHFVRLGCCCGGALIAPDIVLTGGHCRYRTGWQVHMGVYRHGIPSLVPIEENSRIVTQYVNHNKYDGKKLGDQSYNGGTRDDMSLAKLDRPYYWSNQNIVIKLNDDQSIPKKNEYFTQIGLGREKFDKLDDEGNIEETYRPEFVQKVEVRGLKDKECSDMYSRFFDQYNEDNKYKKKELNKNGWICHGGLDDGKGTCKGDSGSPFFRITQRDDGKEEHLHLGTMSRSEKYPECALEDQPSILASTSKSYQWIMSAMCTAPLCGAHPDCDSFLADPKNADYLSKNDFDPNSCDNVVEDDDCDGAEAIIEAVTIEGEPGQIKPINNPNYPGDSEPGFWKFALPTFTLKDDDGNEIMKRSYFFEDFTNRQDVCLEQGKCYTLVLNNMDYNNCIGDDCQISSGKYAENYFKSYKIEVGGSQIASKDEGVTFGETVRFCVGCLDTKNFRIDGKKCKNFIDKAEDKEASCELYHQQDGEVKRVLEWCPATCGTEGYGQCGSCQTAQNDPSFLVSNKDCDDYLKKNFKSKCKKIVDGESVAESCPETCFEKIGSGACAN